jgi:hypothetical protein
MKTRRIAVRCAVLVLGVTVLGACVHPPKGPPPTRPTTTTTKPATAEILFEYRASGGLCPDTACGTTMTFRRDGSYHLMQGQQERDGQAHRFVLINLIAQMEEGLDTLADLPKRTGPCPSASDGSDITITFHAGGETVTVSNCAQPRSESVEIPGDSELLQSVSEVVRDPEFQPVPRPAFFQYQERGGVCLDTPCAEEHVDLFMDGKWNATLGTRSASGTLDVPTMVEVWRLVLEELAKEQPLAFAPAEECTYATGGREVLVTFGLFPSGPLTFSDCRVDLSSNELAARLIDLTSDLI